MMPWVQRFTIESSGDSRYAVASYLREALDPAALE
jgi:hypothetical protein